ncbi:hypothetical protein GGF46_003493 [Coemansia sp. RSA 552]|nr:hypothetical protein GGF46_003493 [Coemansia sp. RSA 552]
MSNSAPAFRASCLSALLRQCRPASGLGSLRRVHSGHGGKQAIRRLKKDAYTTLGVGAQSTPEEVKAQYYRVCRQLQPGTQTADQEQVPSLLGMGQAQWAALDYGGRQKAIREQFAAAREAYEVLGDSALRRQHDVVRSGSRYNAMRRGTVRDPWAGEGPAGPRKAEAEGETEGERRLISVVVVLMGAAMMVGAYQHMLLVDTFHKPKDQED